jgi:hypothetical protein
MRSLNFDPAVKKPRHIHNLKYSLGRRKCRLSSHEVVLEIQSRRIEARKATISLISRRLKEADPSYQAKKKAA